MRMPEFRHHNIRLETVPSRTLPAEPPIEDRIWVREAVRTLQLAFPNQRDQTIVADLGCLEGGYALEFARAGFDVVGIEVRPSNFKCCEYVTRHTRQPRLSFHQDDAWNAADYGPFDAVFVGGLLYHLDEPVRCLKMIAETTRSLLILNTHFAVEDRIPAQHELGPLQAHEGYTGRWYVEFPDTKSFEKRNQYKLSSWQNSRSFWLLENEIERALSDAGFEHIEVINKNCEGGFNRQTIVAKKKTAHAENQRPS